MKKEGKQVNGPLWRSDSVTKAPVSAERANSFVVLSAQFGSQKQCYLSNYYYWQSYSVVLSQY